MNKLINLYGESDDKYINDQLKLLEKVGIQYASIRLLKKTKETLNETQEVTFYSDQEWGKHYLENKYNFYDKVDRFINEFDSFSAPWITLSENNKEQEVSYVREYVFSIKNGFTMVATDNSYKSALSLASYEKDKGFIDRITQNPEVIQRFFQTSVDHLLSKYFS